MTVKTERLVKAIQTVTDHQDWTEDETPDVIVALLSIREELTVDEVTTWVGRVATEDEVEAYIEVLNASHWALSAALRVLL